MTIFGRSLPDESRPQPVHDENYAIYSLIIRDLLSNVPAGAAIVMLDRTQDQWGDSTCLTEAQPMKRNHEYDEAIRNYLKNNRVSKAVEKSFSLPVPYRIVGDPSQDGDSKERRTLFVVSDVGMNAAHDRSIVYVAYDCGNLCGRGAVYFLRKEGGQWSYDSHFGPPVCFWVR